jgi:perosamine synthetase
VIAPAPRLPLLSLLRRDPAGGVTALLARQRAVMTHATRVAIRAGCDLLGLVPGDEVLVPAYHCGSEVDPLLEAGLTLRLYPVAADTAVSPEEIAARIGPRTRAIYLIHYFGFPQPQGPAIRALCDALGLVLMEDCALSLLSQGPAQSGRLGDVAFHCFSKFFPVEAGGALVVNRPDLSLPGMDRAAPLRPALRLLARAVLAAALGRRGIAGLKALRGGGMGAPGADALLPDMPQDYYFDPDLSGRRLSPLVGRALAGMSVAQAVMARRRNFALYLRLLRDLPGVTPLFTTLPEGVCPLNFPVLVAGRDRLALQMAQAGIAVVPWWAGYHRALNFAEFAPARRLKDGVLALPLHQGLSEAQASTVAQSLAALRQAEGRFQAPE